MNHLNKCMLKLQKHKPEEKQQVFQVLLVQPKSLVVTNPQAIPSLLQTPQKLFIAKFYLLKRKQNY